MLELKFVVVMFTVVRFVDYALFVRVGAYTWMFNSVSLCICGGGERIPDVG